MFCGEPIGVVGTDLSNGDNNAGFIGDPHLELDGGRVDIEEHLVEKVDWPRLTGWYASIRCKGRFSRRLGWEKDSDWFWLITPVSNGVTLWRLVKSEGPSDNWLVEKHIA